MSETLPNYRVRAVHCDHRSTEAEIAAALARVTAPLERAWAKLEAAERIVVKANIVWPPEQMRLHDGRKQELVDDSVLRATLALLRERTQARVTVVDTSLCDDLRDIWFGDLLAEYDVDFVNCNEPPFVTVPARDGGVMFGEYKFHESVVTADALVSLCTLKSHNFMGVTLSTKNLFGLCPVHAECRPRWYYHHLVRMPYFLADLGATLDPALCIVDGLMAQSGREWGGPARATDVLLAGEQNLATDMCGAVLMGHDPLSDWPTPPFRRDKNHLKVAAAQGWGPATPADIDFQHDLRALPLAEFDSDGTDPPERVASWLRTMAEQALSYQADPTPFYEFAGDYILLQDGVVLGHSDNPLRGMSRRTLSGAKPDRAIWLKYVDPNEREAEKFGIYHDWLGAGL